MRHRVFLEINEASPLGSWRGGGRSKKCYEIQIESVRHGSPVMVSLRILTPRMLPCGVPSYTRADRDITSHSNIVENAVIGHVGTTIIKMSAEYEKSNQ